MDETAHFMDETAHFLDENITFQSYGSKGHFMDETAKLMEKKKYQPHSLTDSKNYKLDKVLSTGQFILRNSFDYLTYTSTVLNTNIACIIIDYFSSRHII